MVSRATIAEGDNWLLYDGECPFCSAYVRLVRLREAVGVLRLIDARGGGSELGWVTSLGHNIDQTMILHLDGKLYSGGDCLNRLALLSSPSTTFNRLNRFIFRHAGLASFLYPMLRFCRNCTLALLGVSKIRH